MHQARYETGLHDAEGELLISKAQGVVGECLFQESTALKQQV
jgi:hypothetical protein